MKEIKLGTCFSIPLENEEYGFGYVNYEGRFLMVNIVDFKSTNPKDVQNLFDKSLLITDWLIDWIVFSNIKTSSYPKWKLHRNVILTDYQEPKFNKVIIGSNNEKKCLNFITNEVYDANDNELSKYPQFSTYYVDYYSVFVRSKYNGFNFSKVVYDRDKNKYVLV